MRIRELYQNLLKRYRKEILTNVILLILISILSVLGPLFLKEAIEKNAETGLKAGEAGSYILLLSGLYLMKFVYHRFRFWFEEKFKNTETEELYRKIFLMSYEEINRIEPTYLTERVGSTVDTIFSLYSSSISGIFISVLTILLILLIIIRTSWILALLYFLQIPIQYFGFEKLLNGENSRLSEYGILLQETRARNNKNIKAVMSDVDSIKQYGEKDGIITFVKKWIQDTNHIARTGNRYAMDMCTLLEYICQILKNMSYLFIIFLYVSGMATVGDLVYLNLMNDIYYQAIGDAIQIQVNLRDLKAAMKFILEEVEKKKEEDGSIEIQRIDTVSGEIRNVGYEKNVLIAEGQFSFQRGTIVALRGASGTGKSTFVKLLNKFLTCDGIYVNGINVKKITNASLRSRVFYIAQTSYLLPLSIKENITLGEAADPGRWNELLEMEFMKKFTELRDGLETVVYENGTNLSGGDRQKIVLARIFLRNPDVIILDESFSAIDEKTGKEMMEQIMSLYSDRIVIVISHSEKYLKKCDTVVKIENKRLLQVTN